MFALTKLIQLGVNDDFFCMTRSVIFEIAVQSAVHSGRKFCRDYHWHNLGRGKVYFNKACLLECLGEDDTVPIGILTHTYF